MYYGMTKSGCICNAYWIQKESKQGDFFDPENKLPIGSDGLKIRVMHSGCPKHNGKTNRRYPMGWPNYRFNEG